MNGHERPYVPHWDDVPDYFHWEAFDRASQDLTRRLHGDSAQQEALLAETDTFYVIPDQFGVVDGHVLVLPKASHSSMANLDQRHDAELRWLLEHCATVIADLYDAHPIMAEHGECGCATAGQAHVHVLPVPSRITPAELEATLDRVLVRRVVGIERVRYRDTDFTAVEDLRALAPVDGATVVGRQILTRDLVAPVEYPADARTTTGLTRPYVYFRGLDIEFLSTADFRSQFVREVVGLAVGLPDGAWDRWVNTSRAHMFHTFERLAGPLRTSGATAYRYGPRATG